MLSTVCFLVFLHPRHLIHVQLENLFSLFASTVSFLVILTSNYLLHFQLDDRFVVCVSMNFSFDGCLKALRLITQFYKTSLFAI